VPVRFEPYDMGVAYAYIDGQWLECIADTYAQVHGRSEKEWNLILSPQTVTRFNGHDIMVVKVQGEFVWHKHDDTDDFFLVLQGRLTIHLRDRDVVLGPGELFVVPRGIEHQPFAEEETHLLLIEPTGTPNTGDKATAAPQQFI
jgi:mannose-6-phosphate isomerase-like protein (cupin superfamily)